MPRNGLIPPEELFLLSFSRLPKFKSCIDSLFGFRSLNCDSSGDNQIELRYFHSTPTPTINRKIQTLQPHNRGSGATLLEVIEVEVHSSDPSLKQILRETNRKRRENSGGNTWRTSLESLTRSSTLRKRRSSL